MPLDGFPGYRREDAEKYRRLGCWQGMTFGDLVDRASERHPAKEALVDDTSRLTYGELREKVDALAVRLVELGIGRLDRVLVQLPNWNEFVYTYFALQKIGAIVVLLVPRHGRLEIDHLCRLTGAVAWVGPGKYRGADNLSVIEEVVKANPQLKHLVLVRREGGERFVTLERLMRDIPPDEERLRQLNDRRPDPMEVAHMGPTGGTTGLPKVAPRTHNDHICNIEYKARSWELSDQDVCVAVTPVGHDMTFTVAVCGTILRFGKLVLLDSTKPEDFCAVAEREKATCAVMVPALAMRIAHFENLEDYDLGSLWKLHVGGAPSPPDLIRRIRKRVGCAYVVGLGSTEGLNAMTRLDDRLEVVCRTSGRPCCPHSEYRVFDKEGRELPAGRVGELAIRGPDVFAGYFQFREENREVFTRDGFFKTGDLASIDESGHIIVKGRIKEVILRGGENIIPSEIEALILKHPDVEAVAVMGMPDRELGERICAYVQPVSGSRLSFDDVISFLKREGASRLQLPEKIEFVSRIPLTKVGKIDKRALHHKGVTS